MGGGGGGGGGERGDSVACLKRLTSCWSSVAEDRLTDIAGSMVSTRQIGLFLAHRRFNCYIYITLYNYMHAV